MPVDDHVGETLGLAGPALVRAGGRIAAAEPVGKRGGGGRGGGTGRVECQSESHARTVASERNGLWRE